MNTRGPERGEVPAEVSGPSPQREHLLTASSVPQSWTRGLGHAGAQTPVGELCNLPWRGGLSSPDVSGPVPPMLASTLDLAIQNAQAWATWPLCRALWASPVSQWGPPDPALPQEGLPPSQETSEPPHGCASGQSWKPIVGQTPSVPTRSLKHRPRPVCFTLGLGISSAQSLCVALSPLTWS